MEIKITTRQMLTALYILAWIIFIGVCIEAGGFIFRALYSLVVKPENAGKFWAGLDLSALYNNDQGHFFALTFKMCIVAVMRAILFYGIVKLLHHNRLDISQPFNKYLGRFIFNVSYLSLGIGLFSIWGGNYRQWLISQGLPLPELEDLRMGGGDVWLFMGVTLYVIAQIFKKGIEIQTENELTV